MRSGDRGGSRGRARYFRNRIGTIPFGAAPGKHSLGGFLRERENGRSLRNILPAGNFDQEPGSPVCMGRRGGTGGIHKTGTAISIGSR